jgi:undecaprenyl-diphosphatase
MSPTLLQIAILSIVQGAAEPLPVSSSAHVIAAEKIMRLDPSVPEMTFLLAMLHTGTMVAVIAYFWQSWKRSFFSSRAQFRTALARVVLATAVTLAVYFALEFLITKTTGAEVEDLFANMRLVAAALAGGGVLIFIAGFRSRSKREAPAATGPTGQYVPAGVAFWIGAAQGLCLPFRGLSRSGATISTGMLLGVPRRASEEFSFALAVVITPPVIVREFCRFYRARAALSGGVHIGALAAPGLLGMVFSFGAGLLALRWLTGWLDGGRWHYFGIYCLAAAAGVFALARTGY